MMIDDPYSRQNVPRGQHPRGGAILLIVLGFIMLTAVVVVSLLESVTRNIRSAAAAAARDDLRVTAFSAMQVALASIAEIKELDEGLYSPSQGWGNAANYAPVQWPESMQVSISIQDETGKLPMVPPDRDLLHQLFEQMGIGFGEADELIDAYLDWTDEDDLERINGAEIDYYETLEPERQPPNEPITSFEAFRYIKGFDELFFEENGTPNQRFQQFRRSVSIRHSEAVNLNTASPELREILVDSGLNEGAFDDFRTGLDGIPGTPDDGFIKSADDLESMGLNSSEGFGYEAKIFRIIVRVSQGEKHFQLEALVSNSTGAEDSQNQSSSNGGQGSVEGRETLGSQEQAVEMRTGIGVRSEEATVEEPSSNREGRQTGESQTQPVYQIGDWMFLELSENGSEDG